MHLRNRVKGDPLEQGMGDPPGYSPMPLQNSVLFNHCSLWTVIKKYSHLEEQLSLGTLISRISHLKEQYIFRAVIFGESDLYDHSS